MTGNFAFAGIDQALWDLCGKECGQPLYRLFGGALRAEVDYFYYLSQASPEEIRRQAEDGVRRGYTCFYLKVGIDAAAETEMLAALRSAIGGARKIRVDANQAWTVSQAAKILARWNELFEIDFLNPKKPIPRRETFKRRARVIGIAAVGVILIQSSASLHLYFPDNVPAIEPDIRGAKTIREQLAKHRSQESCAVCHVKIDPPGFALENFDPAGQWRDRYIQLVDGRLLRHPLLLVLPGDVVVLLLADQGFLREHFVAGARDHAQPVPASRRMVLRRQSQPRNEVAPRLERLRITDLAAQQHRADRPEPGYRRQPPCRLVLPVAGHQLLFELRQSAVRCPILLAEHVEQLADDLAVNRAIRPIAGATLTARETTNAVRRILAIDVILEKQEAAR